MPVAEEIMSPELVLVSPPELAAQARDSLPDYEVEFAQWVTQVRAATVPEPMPERDEPLSTMGALAFTALAAVACVAPLVLLIVFR